MGKEDLVNGWWYPVGNPKMLPDWRKIDLHREPNYCPKCKKCWEHSRVYKYVQLKTNPLKAWVWHDEIPSIGKKRVICPKCEGK